MNTILEASNCLLLSTDQKKSESLWRNDACYKFIYSLKGEMSYQSKRNDLSVAQNEFLIFNPTEEHLQISVEQHKFLVELDYQFLNEATAVLTGAQKEICFAQIMQRNPVVDQWVHSNQDFILQDASDESSSSDVFLEHSLAQLSLLLVQSAMGTHTSDLAIHPFRSVQPALLHVMNTLKEDYQHAWRLDEMANILGVSKFQFAHLFKERIGISPYSWLQLYRIVRSQDLLKHTDLSITDIALSCGFSSTGMYNQLFKRLYGFTPSFFRRCYTK